jgi:hypothetical protein
MSIFSKYVYNGLSGPLEYNVLYTFNISVLYNMTFNIWIAPFALLLTEYYKNTYISGPYRTTAEISEMKNNDPAAIQSDKQICWPAKRWER